MTDKRDLPKCLGCGRPIHANPTDTSIAKQSDSDHGRCTTCWEVGDLFAIVKGEGDLV